MAGNWIWKLTPKGLKLKKIARKLDKMQVDVGFQEGATYENGISVAQVAAWNEYGTTRMPARPFIRTTFSRDRDKIQNYLSAEVKKMIETGDIDAEATFNRIGAYSKSLVQKNIREGPWVPNAPSTIRKKGSSRPLIDTGQMRQSVQYVVRER